MALPLITDWTRAIYQWKSQLDPILAKESNLPVFLVNVSLKAGIDNVINHKLGRKLTGWKITRQRQSAIIYDNQDSNQKPDLTLILLTNADVSIDLEVF